ncbi:MAG TPA: hypothetical protein PKH17_03795 [Candidatus Syntrophosphaera sp.]|nr:hypothetical protein [Candidatus Syntrophosphaera sp.]
MNKREENNKNRNNKIREEVEELIGEGIKREIAIEIVAERYYLSALTVRDIIYDKRRK